jgi:hypothetical protein
MIKYFFLTKIKYLPEKSKKEPLLEELYINLNNLNVSWG